MEVYSVVNSGKFYSKILLTFIVSILLVGCSTTQEDSSSDKSTNDDVSSENNELIVARKMEPGNMDPHFITSTSTSNYVFEKVYQGLVTRDEDGMYAPSLAEEWKQVDDKTWEFKLREGVTFHDGVEFNAESVKVNFDRLLDDKVASPRASVFAMVEKLTVVDDYTIQFNLSFPYAALLSILSSSEGSIISTEVIQNETVDLATHPVGTGPFKFESWSSGVGMTLASYEDYWGEVPKSSKVIYKVVPEDSTRLAMLETGEAHIVDQLPVTDVDRLKESNDISVLEVEGFGVDFIGFNVTSEPFDNVKVRQAVAYALEKDAILKGVYNNIGSVIDSTMSTKVVGYNPNLKDYEYNINKAKELLKEAGFADGFKTTIVTDERKERVNLAEVLQSQLKGIGIDIEIVVLEYNVYIDATAKGADGIYIGGWGNSTGDADYNQFNLFHSSSIGPTGNISFYNNPKVDELMEKARQESDPDARNALYAELQQIELDEVPVIPIRSLTHLAAVSNDVKGFWMNPVGYYNFDNVSVK